MTRHKQIIHQITATCPGCRQTRTVTRSISKKRRQDVYFSYCRPCGNARRKYGPADGFHNDCSRTYRDLDGLRLSYKRYKALEQSALQTIIDTITEETGRERIQLSKDIDDPQRVLLQQMMMSYFRNEQSSVTVEDAVSVIGTQVRYNRHKIGFVPSEAHRAKLSNAAKNRWERYRERKKQE